MSLRNMLLAAASVEAQLPLTATALSDANAFLRNRVLRTPVRRLHWLERIIGVPVWAKLENHQHTGSFKYRGALYRMRLMQPGEHVVAASAGNHGLAVATVARRLRLRATVVLPTTCNPSKRARIVSTGSDVIEHGGTLAEAIEFAEHWAPTVGAAWISPYDDADMIAANATIALELFEDLAGITALVVPVGGGGLIAGMALAARATAPGITVHGCEPATYASMQAALAENPLPAVRYRPTLADGLAVTVRATDMTVPLARSLVSSWVTLSEEELAAGTVALLHHESVLAEPAGAASIIGCIRLAEQGLLRGPVGIPVCGSNISDSSLAVTQTYPFCEPSLLRLLDLTGRDIHTTEVIRSTVSAAPSARTIGSSPTSELKSLLAAARSNLAAVCSHHEDYQRYLAEEQLIGVTTAQSMILAHARAVSREIEVPLPGNGAEEPTSPSTRLEELITLEARLRWALSTIAHATTALEWCSPSYMQSRCAQFFDTSCQKSSTANYERYGTPEISALERHIQGVFGYHDEQLSFLITSSGMAAYAVIEAYLLRSALRAGDTVVMTPYVYFEVTEQLEALSHIRSVRAAGYDAASIVSAITEHDARVVFVDVISNNAEQRVVDLPELMRLLARRGREITVVVDGTMASGGVPCELLGVRGNVRVLYFESCSKYLQNGLDATMAGIVIAPLSERAQLERLRRNSGATPSRHSCLLYPRFDAAAFRRRMTRISAAASRFVTTFGSRNFRATTVSPGHSSHRDFAHSSWLPYFGGCITFEFFRPFNRIHIDAIIERALHHARQHNFPFTKGVSFGFSVPRISAAAAMAEGLPPFMRLYVGDLEQPEVDTLALIMDLAITELT